MGHAEARREKEARRGGRMERAGNRELDECHEWRVSCNED